MDPIESDLRLSHLAALTVPDQIATTPPTRKLTEISTRLTIGTNEHVGNPGILKVDARWRAREAT
jgi:hypothetical protein